MRLASISVSQSERSYILHSFVPPPRSIPRLRKQPLLAKRCHPPWCNRKLKQNQPTPYPLPKPTRHKGARRHCTRESVGLDGHRPWGRATHQHGQNISASPVPHAVLTLPTGAPQVTTTVEELRLQNYSPVIKAAREYLELRTGGRFSIAAIGYIRVSISTLVEVVGDFMHVCRKHVFCLVVSIRNFSPHTRCCQAVVINCARILYLYLVFICLEMSKCFYCPCLPHHTL